jgi:uncharacterized coiled-coil protein SlyX
MSIADAVRFRELEAKVAAMVPVDQEERLAEIERMLTSLTRQISMLRGQVNAMRAKRGGAIPDTPLADATA